MDGSDLSNWNTDAHWQQALTLQFCILKATEGKTFQDPQYSPRIVALRNANMLTGAYHYAHVNNDPVMECDAFLAYA